MHQFFTDITVLSQNLTSDFFRGSKLESQIRFEYFRGILRFLHDLKLTAEQLRVAELDWMFEREGTPTPEQEKILNSPIFSLGDVVMPFHDFGEELMSEFCSKFGPGTLFPVNGCEMAEMDLDLVGLLIAYSENVQQLVDNGDEVKIELNDGQTAKLTPDKGLVLVE